MRDTVACGARLLQMRRKLDNISRERFSAVIGVSARTLQDWEAGISYPAYKHLAQLNTRTGVCLNWLITGEGEPGMLRLS